MGVWGRWVYLDKSLRVLEENYVSPLAEMHCER